MSEVFIKVMECVLSTSSATVGHVRWTAHELRKLPAHERAKILEATASEAEGEYRANRDLTEFEAFGKDDLHGDSSDSEAIALASDCSSRTAGDPCGAF